MYCQESVRHASRWGGSKIRGLGRRRVYMRERESKERAPAIVQ